MAGQVWEEVPQKMGLKKWKARLMGQGRVKNGSRHKQERMLRGNKDTANKF